MTFSRNRRRRNIGRHRHIPATKIGDIYDAFWQYERARQRKRDAEALERVAAIKAAKRAAKAAA